MDQQNLTIMKEMSIIPLLKLESSGLSFKVQSIKNAIEEQDEKNELPHSHSHYELIWMINGKGILYIDMDEYTLENNMIYCLKPNQPHQFQTSIEMEGFVFSFTDGFFNVGEHELEWIYQANLFQLFSKCHAIKIPDGIEEELKDIVLKMTKENENSVHFNSQVLKQYFRIFLLYLARQVEQNFQLVAQTRESELVKSFMETLDKRYKEKKLVTEYATLLLVSPNYLSKTVKKYTGYSAGYHVRQRIVLEAKRLARYSDAGMKEIAYSLGFDNIAHFSRFFKAFTGTNFSNFKKEGVVIPLVVANNRS